MVWHVYGKVIILMSEENEKIEESKITMIKPFINPHHHHLHLHLHILSRSPQPCHRRKASRKPNQQSYPTRSVSSLLTSSPPHCQLTHSSKTLYSKMEINLNTYNHISSNHHYPLSICYPSLSSNSSSLYQIFKPDLIISSFNKTQHQNSSTHHIVSSFSDLSVLLDFPKSNLRFFLLRMVTQTINPR